MKITKNQLRRIIKEEKARLMEANPNYPPDRDPTALQMSTPEQRDPGAGQAADAARLLSGILDDWMNEPAMNGNPGDDYFDRVEAVMLMLNQLG